MLAHASYGKERVRLVQVLRGPDRHDLRDLTVGVRFEGEYEASYTGGDNSDVLPTDTMKNTVYALAAREHVREPEIFGIVLARHFLDRRLARVRIEMTEHRWARIPRGDRQYGQAFVRQGPDTRTALVEATRDRVHVSAGAADLTILKSSHSAFSGFPRDEFTTLPETRDRLLATALTATWVYRSTEIEFGSAWHAVRNLLLDTFAAHHSESVQHTLHAMGQAVIESVQAGSQLHSAECANQIIIVGFR